MGKHRLHRELFPVWLAPLALVGLLGACGDTDKAPPDGTGAPAAGGAPATPPPAADTQPAGGAGAPADSPAPGAAAGAGGGPGTPQQIALGDSIFHGQAGGGTCYACHGQDGKGSAVGPNLTDGEWLNTDGSLGGITKTVQTGVPTPKKAPAPMPPMGGASLTPDQVRAVAAYVHSLSKGGR
jgi:mono/diheme cytochrome c family protein